MKLTTKYKDKSITLNKRLITKQGLSEQKVNDILREHKYRLKLLTEMEELDPVKDNKAIQDYERYIMNIDMDLQWLWGFRETPRYKIPKTTV